MKDALRLLAALAVLVPAAAAPLWAATEPLTGEALSIDGDTLEIGGSLVQLQGIDAPELGQTCLRGGKRWRCGLEAAFALKRALVLGSVSCLPSRTEGPRILALCTRGSVDLAEELLRKGYAVVADDATPGYRRAESAARAAGLGLWRGEFVRPWDWRRGVRLSGGPSDAVVVCEVKGVINDRGQRVFYVPGDKGYDNITVDPAKGERLFCSDDEALLRGWRHLPLR